MKNPKKGSFRKAKEMIIESIRIVSFGCLREFECSFHDSFNVIEGRNESGKSTLAAFVKYMLYGFGRKNSEQTLSERKKYINSKKVIAAMSDRSMKTLNVAYKKDGKEMKFKVEGNPHVSNSTEGFYISNYRRSFLVDSNLFPSIVVLQIVVILVCL